MAARLALLTSAAWLFAAPSSYAFVPPHRRFGVCKLSVEPLRASDLPHTKETLVGKEFQLEEREDKDSEITELWLRSDGTVELGTTDGPPVESYDGTWSILETASEDDRPFRMRLDRTYKSGSRTGETDPGETDYHVKREFWGNTGSVGEMASVTGVMHGSDEAADVDCEVGYFSLIDASSEGVEGENRAS